MEKFPKYLIQDGKLIIGKVFYHKELTLDSENPKPKGGGWFKFDTDTRTFHLYSESYDFGQPTLKDVEEAIKSGKMGDIFREQRYKDCNFTFSTSERYEDSITNRVIIEK